MAVVLVVVAVVLVVVDAHQDTEVSHCCVSKDYGDVYSDSHQNVATSTSLLSAECLSFRMTHGWQKSVDIRRTISYVIVHVIVLILLYCCTCESSFMKILQ